LLFVKRWNGFLPGPWLGQKLSCHDKFAKRQRQKTMEACALAGRHITLSRWQEVVPVDNLAKWFQCSSWDVCGHNQPVKACRLCQTKLKA